jgi:hypothetical protein
MIIYGLFGRVGSVMQTSNMRLLMFRELRCPTRWFQGLGGGQGSQIRQIYPGKGTDGISGDVTERSLILELELE